MTSSDIRLELHQLIDRVDDQFVQAVHAIVKAYIKKDEVIGYEPDGKPVMASQFIEESNQAIERVKQGKEGISVEELEKRSRAWLSHMK